MNAVVIYESMFGGTRQVGVAIARGLEATGLPSSLVAASDAPVDLSSYRLVVVGAPTHAHSMPRASSRRQAAEWAQNPDKGLTLESGTENEGVREWLKRLPTDIPRSNTAYATFSTRVDMARILSGDASVAIEKRLHGAGRPVLAHADFLVDHDSVLVDGELDRAQAWAASVANMLTPLMFEPDR